MTDDSTPTPLLDVVGLSAGYGRVRVLNDVSLRVAPGSITAVIGPNGAGKTTMLRSVSGFVTTLSGSISIDGVDVTRLRPFKRARMGLTHIPEGRGVYRGLTVRENLMLQTNDHDENKVIERATSAFAVLGRCLDQRAGTLSGGEQQMLAISAAYVRSPRLLLVDEPSLGLAPQITDTIFRFLESVAADGVALVVVDQFVDHVLELADTVSVIRHGEVVFTGPTSDFSSSDAHEYYLGADNAAIVDTTSAG